MKKKKKEASIDWAEVYRVNRTNGLIDFKNALEEVQRDKPSVGGKIAGMDYQQFSASTIFQMIVEQEKYCVPPQPAYVDTNEEQQILKQMVKDAKKVFGKNYKQWYDHAKKIDEL